MSFFTAAASFSNLVLQLSAAEARAIKVLPYGKTSQEIALVAKDRNARVHQTYVDRPFSTTIGGFAAVHVGQTLPTDMILHPGGSVKWQAQQRLSDRSITVKIPQIFSFATPGGVIPFDTCARWNASPVTMIFPLNDLMKAGIASVGPELMFCRPVHIPLALVNRDLIPEESRVIQEHNGRTKFVFYSGGKNETNLALRRNIVDTMLQEMGFTHFAPRTEKYPIPAYNMRFSANGIPDNYVSLFKEHIHTPVSFGWELFSIQGGADLFNRYQAILQKGIRTDCIPFTLFNLHSLRTRLEPYLQQILGDDATTCEKIMRLLDESETMLRSVHKDETVFTDFSDPAVQEELFYQWFEIFKNLTEGHFQVYKNQFEMMFTAHMADSFLSNEGNNPKSRLLVNMLSFFYLVKHIEHASPYLTRQLEGIVPLERAHPLYQYDVLELSTPMWKQLYRFYYCAPLDDEKISDADILTFKKELQDSFAKTAPFGASRIEIFPCRKEPIVALSQRVSSLALGPFYGKQPCGHPQYGDPRACLGFTEEDWGHLRAGNIDRLIAQVDPFYRARVYELAVVEGHLQYLSWLSAEQCKGVLHYAARLGKKKLVEELLKAKVLSSPGYAIIYACNAGHYDIAILLLRTFDFDVKDWERSAFSEALKREAYTFIDAFLSLPNSAISVDQILSELSQALKSYNELKAEKLLSYAMKAFGTTDLGQLLLYAAQHPSCSAVTLAYLQTHPDKVSQEYKSQILEVAKQNRHSSWWNDTYKFIAEMLEA